MTLLICTTCPRDDPSTSGDFARAIADTITSGGGDIPVQNVPCLAACCDDGAVAPTRPG